MEDCRRTFMDQLYSRRWKTFCEKTVPHLHLPLSSFFSQNSPCTGHIVVSHLNMSFASRMQTGAIVHGDVIGFQKSSRTDKGVHAAQLLVRG
eukprot:755354-Hanusia_phi.AAC.2